MARLFRPLTGPGSGRRALLTVVGTLVACMIALVGPVSAQLATPTSGQPTSGQVLSLDDALKNWPRFDDRQKLAVLEQVIRAGKFDLADKLLDEFHPRATASKLRARFLLGVLRKAQGRVDDAIQIFRDLLASNPQFQRVRLELAHALFLKQEDTSARHHFDLVLGSATNANLQKTVQRFIDAMDKRKRWHVSGYFSLAPSTNINQGADARTVTFDGLTFTIDDASRKKSGVGFNGGLSGGYRFPLSDKLDFVVGGGAHLKRYKQAVFNDTIISAEAGPRYRFKKGNVALYGTATRRFHGGEGNAFHHGDGYAWYYGGRVQSAFRLGPKDIARAGGSCQRKTHDVLTYQDGWGCSVSLSEDHFLDGRSFARVLGGVGRERTQVAHLDYDSANIGVGYYSELPFGLSVYGQAKYSRRNYEGIYPTASQARKDDRVDLTLQLTKRDWQIFGLAPRLQYTYTWNDSNIGFHTYDAHGVNLTWTKKF